MKKWDLINKRKKGFTLVELIVVIAIMAILAAVLVPTITNKVTSANDTVAQSEAREMINLVRNAYLTKYETVADINNVSLTEIYDYVAENYNDGVIVKDEDGTHELYRSSEKKYVLRSETIGGNKCITVSFLMAKDGSTYRVAYDIVTRNLIIPD